MTFRVLILERGRLRDTPSLRASFDVPPEIGQQIAIAGQGNVIVDAVSTSEAEGAVGALIARAV